MRTVIPTGVKVLVLKDRPKETTMGGIVIPAIAERTPRFSPTVFATVLGRGPKCDWVQVGDRVAVKNVAGDDWEFDGELVTMLREKDLIGISTKETT